MTLHGPAGRRALIVASTGGHLVQASLWADRLELAADSTFLTFRSAQSESLLADRRSVFVPYVAPRDWRGVVRTTHLVSRALRGGAFDLVLSTGAGVALSCVLPTRAQRVPFHYVESVSRFDGPSLTGRILARLPGVHTWTQHSLWAGARWRFAGSILEDYETVSRPHGSGPGLRIFVTLGTIKPYRFDRVVERVHSLLSPDDSVVWQLGTTTRADLPGASHEYLSADAFRAAAVDADVVVAQAGVGGIMDLLELGISPVVVPRRSAHREHVDDHQVQAARVFSELGLVRHVDASHLTRGDLLQAPAVRRVGSSPPEGHIDL